MPSSEKYNQNTRIIYGSLKFAFIDNNVFQFEASTLNALSMLLPCCCLQEINSILNKRRTRITENLRNAAAFNQVNTVFYMRQNRLVSEVMLRLV